MEKYTKAILEEAIKQSTNFMDVARYFNTGINMENHFRTKAKRLGINIGHFRKYRKYSKEVLEDAVRKSVSYAGVARCLGLAPVGGNTCHIRDMIVQFQINTNHFTKQAHNKGKISHNRRSAEEILIVYPKGSLRAKGEILRRALLEIGREEKCEECGLEPKWNNKKLRLHIDHKDGNYLNCVPENLRYLCPNCHSQTETWGSKKKNVLQQVE